MTPSRFAPRPSIARACGLLSLGALPLACAPNQSSPCEEPLDAIDAAPDPMALWTLDERARGYRLDDARLLSLLRPTYEAPITAVEITLPLPGGRIARERAIEVTVLSPPLAARHPEIHSWDLTDMDSGRKGRAVWTRNGLNAVVDTATGPAQIERTSDGRYRAVRLACIQSDALAKPKWIEDAAAEAKEQLSGAPLLPSTSSFQPRQFEILIATETRYTEQIVRAHGGDPDAMDPLSEKEFAFPYLVELLNQVNHVFATNVGVSFYFHPDEIDWLYTSPINPWAGTCSGSGLAIAGENGVAIATGSFASGHAPDLATVLVQCDGVGDSTHSYSRWRGLCGAERGESAVITGVGLDHPSLRYFLAHELGHLLGASHTFSLAHWSSNGDRHYEPGCGSTIMAYGGIVEECRASGANEDYVGEMPGHYFSAYSVAEMQSYIAKTASDECGRPLFARDPSAPVVIATPEIMVPAKTPFYLKVDYSVADSSDVSSFDLSFDQVDDGCVLCNGGTPFGRDTGNDSIVRSRFYGGVPASVGSFVRYVPDFADLVAIADPAVSSARPEELLPQGDRALHFIGSVRAQHVAAATVGAAAIAVRAVERPGSDGFRFTSSPAIANCGDTVELDWDDAGTALDAGFDAAHVRFKLCLEGCDVPSHYDVLLSDGQGSSLFANNGHATIAVPSLPRSSSSARILIENEGATFFNVTRADLEYRRCEQGVAQSPTPSINGNPAAAIAANGG